MKLTTLKPTMARLQPTMQTVNPSSWRSTKESSTARGYGYKWQQARADWLRAHPLCVVCLNEPGERVTAATVVDHAIPHRGDQNLFWDRKNWQSMCKPHHDAKTKAEERKGPGGVGKV